MKTTKKACLVFSLLCLGVFSGCENAVENGRNIQHSGDGSVSVTDHSYYPDTNEHVSRTTDYGTQGEFQDAETGRWIWGIVKTLLSGPSN
jgi:hypothetical protein